MSRSNPNESGLTNPAVRWFEWSGEHGVVRYYDKEAKRNVDVGSDFAFVLLDQLGSVRGWHDASESGIYSNEVKDTRADVLIVKAFKGGTLAEGLYKDIKDRVNANGGRFNAHCYLAFKLEDGSMAIGCLRLKGAALSSWMEFSKTNRRELYTHGVRITGYTEAKKGKIVYRMPELKLVPLSAETHETAVKLDAQLQEFLAAYLSKNKREQVESPHLRDEEIGAEMSAGTATEVTVDDIPF